MFSDDIAMPNSPGALSRASSRGGRDFIAPYSKQYVHRIRLIHEKRAEKDEQIDSDPIASRVGSSFYHPGPDLSRSHHSHRNFGFVPSRPLSRERRHNDSDSESSSLRGRTRSRSFDRSGSEASLNRSRSGSRSASRGRSNSVSSQRSRSSAAFEKELKFTKDLAAEQKQRELEKEIKKKAYMDYLKNKSSSRPWLPSGEGPKYKESLHRTVNVEGFEKYARDKAVRKTAWPGFLPSEHRFNEGEEDSTGNEKKPRIRCEASAEKIRQRRRSSSNPANVIPSSHIAEPTAVADIPIPLPAEHNEQPSNNFEKFLHPAAAREMEPLNSRDEQSLSSTGALGKTSDMRKEATEASRKIILNRCSKHIAMTIRIIDANRNTNSFGNTQTNPNSQATKSNYGILILKRGGTKIDLINAIEKQFDVYDQISDISVASKQLYSNEVVITSLSLNSIPDIPEIDDSTDMIVYLGGASYQEHENLHNYLFTQPLRDFQHSSSAGMKRAHGLLDRDDLLFYDSISNHIQAFDEYATRDLGRGRGGKRPSFSTQKGSLGIPRDLNSDLLFASPEEKARAVDDSRYQSLIGEKDDPEQTSAQEKRSDSSNKERVNPKVDKKKKKKVQKSPEIAEDFISLPPLPEEYDHEEHRKVLHSAQFPLQEESFQPYDSQPTSARSDDVENSTRGYSDEENLVIRPPTPNYRGPSKQGDLKIRPATAMSQIRSNLRTDQAIPDEDKLEVFGSQEYNDEDMAEDDDNELPAGTDMGDDGSFGQTKKTNTSSSPGITYGGTDALYTTNYLQQYQEARARQLEMLSAQATISKPKEHHEKTSLPESSPSPEASIQPASAIDESYESNISSNSKHKHSGSSERDPSLNKLDYMYARIKAQAKSKDFTSLGNLKEKKAMSPVSFSESMQQAEDKHMERMKLIRDYYNPKSDSPPVDGSVKSARQNSRVDRKAKEPTVLSSEEYFDSLQVPNAELERKEESKAAKEIMAAQHQPLHQPSSVQIPQPSAKPLNDLRSSEHDGGRMRPDELNTRPRSSRNSNNSSNIPKKPVETYDQPVPHDSVRVSANPLRMSDIVDESYFAQPTNHNDRANEKKKIRDQQVEPLPPQQLPASRMVNEQKDGKKVHEVFLDLKSLLDAI